MKEYELRATNTNDADDFATINHYTEGETAESIIEIFDSAMRCNGTIQFSTGARYIVIEEASDEGFMYYIWNSKADYENDDIVDSPDGGQCTGTLSDTLGMIFN